jgi:hypothetical protein
METRMKKKLRLTAIAAVLATTAAIGVPQAANATIYQASNPSIPDGHSHV